MAKPDERIPKALSQKLWRRRNHRDEDGRILIEGGGSGRGVVTRRFPTESGARLHTFVMAALKDRPATQCPLVQCILLSYERQGR